MARRVFISFRFEDGESYKNELCSLFDRSDDVIDGSEDENRSSMTEETIQKYLYEKLKRASITIIILTPKAIEYHIDPKTGKYDDWMYDELRYSLEDREENRTKGAIALYTTDAKDRVIRTSIHRCEVCKKDSEVSTILDFTNLVRKNMMNIKETYKKSRCNNVFDSLEDSYISLVSYDAFVKDIAKYIENADSKRGRIGEFNLIRRL